MDYCSKIRRGLKIPHPRHWPSLRALSTTPMTSKIDWKAKALPISVRDANA
jgi:hypothetical protein